MTDHKPSRRPAPDIQQLIGNTLRIGVTLACAIALVGGLLYLLQHGGEPAKDYSHFPCTASDAERTAYTTLGGLGLPVVAALTATGGLVVGRDQEKPADAFFFRRLAQVEHGGVGLQQMAVEPAGG